MSSCTNSLEQPQSGRQRYTRVPHLVCRCHYHSIPSQAATGHPHEECSQIGQDCSKWVNPTRQKQFIDSVSKEPLNDNIDGESLDSHDWMELVARGLAWDPDESFIPGMILDLSAYRGPDLLSNDKAAVTSEDQSEMSFDDSLDAMDDDDDSTPTDETSWQESSTSSIEDQYDYQIAIG